MSAHLLKNFDWSFKSIAKIVGMLVVAIIVLAVITALISFSFNTIFGGGSYRGYERGYDYAYDGDFAVLESTSFGAPTFSRGISPPIPQPGYTTGTDAEDFEIKEYYGLIKTRKLDATCELISSLKAREDVIFESSNKNEESCNYRFKVEKEKGDEIAEMIESLNPETFNASIQTIKGSIEYYDNELDILAKKLASIEETLNNAQESYDEISVIATRQQNADALAIIIDSKLKLIDKLSNERLNTKSRIDRLNTQKADQLDRLKFTFFNIDIIKDLIFDWKEIKDSWKFETKQLVLNLNETIQAISLHLVTYLIRFAQVVLYLLISLFLLKFVWIGAKLVWRGKKKRK